MRKETEPISSNLIREEVGLGGGHMVSSSQQELQGTVTFGSQRKQSVGAELTPFFP